MNSILVCICGIVLTILAVNASQDDQDSAWVSYKSVVFILNVPKMWAVRVDNVRAFLTSRSTTAIVDQPQSGILRPPFYFGYKRRDYFDATIRLINLSADVVYEIIYEEEYHENVKRTIKNTAGIEDYLVHQQLLEKEIYLQIQLFINFNWCMTIQIFRGRAVDSYRTVHRRFNYNEQCLRSSSPCVLEVDMKDKCTDTPQTDVLRPQFHFGYHKGDCLNAVVNFINLSPDIRYNTHLVESSCKGIDQKDSLLEEINPVSSRDLDNSLGRNYNYSVDQQMNKTCTWIYVAVYSDIDRCASINLFDGTAMFSNGIADSKYNYNDACLNATSPCYMEVDLRNLCLGNPFVSDNITSMSNASTSPHEDMETTTVNSTASVTNKPDESTSSTTNVIVIIVSSLSGITFVVLVVIASWKRCWMRRSPQGTLGLQTNQDNFEPFYLNLLFRRECEREIAEIDGHVYEEIDPPIYEEIDAPIYDEIAPTIDEDIDPPAAGGGRG